MSVQTGDHRHLGWAAVRYLFVGGVLNMGSILIFAGLWSWGIIDAPVLVNLLTSALLFPVWFALNRRWVFKSSDLLGPQMRRAIVTYGAAMVASATLLWLLATVLGMPAVLAQVLTVGLLVAASFLVNALWTFSHRAGPDTPMEVLPARGGADGSQDAA